MARELGMNPKKFGSLANEQHEQWKAPLAEFIESCYLKQFKTSVPLNVRSLEQIIQVEEQRSKDKRARKATSSQAVIIGNNVPENLQDFQVFKNEA